LTCEHAANTIPAAYSAHFARERSVLQTHRAYDLGALPVARHLARTLRAPLYIGTVSRLLVDLNRSLHHRHVHSEFVTGLDASELAAVVARYYKPHRNRVGDHVASRIGKGLCIVHVAVHSFTPALRGEVRNADVGLLYDPERWRERDLCRSWKSILADETDLRVRFNYPYRGGSDGLMRALRARFSPRSYVGIELEMNQRRLHTPADRGAMAATLTRTIRRLLRS
jgi:predicted N-formylglutamate amidohydrolase